MLGNVFSLSNVGEKETVVPGNLRELFNPRGQSSIDKNCDGE